MGMRRAYSAISSNRVKERSSNFALRLSEKDVGRGLLSVGWRAEDTRATSPTRDGGCSNRTCRRQIVNAVFYVLKSGCHWRMLPREFPPWKTVFHYFRAWRLDVPGSG